MTSEELTTQGGNIRFCAHCGTKNAADADSCDRCGERIYLPDPTQPPPLGLAECPKCVTANEIRASYCVKCGSGMANAARITVMGGTDRARQAPHADPAGIRISQRSREGAGTMRRPPAGRPREDEARASRQQREEQPRQRGPIERGQRRWGQQGQQGRRGQAPDDNAPTVNDSGTGSAHVPATARGWNTAAFLIAPVWGPANGVWIGVISLIFLAIPAEALDWGWKLSLYFTYGLFLGFKGNELAWRGRRWPSVEYFKRVQQLWMVGTLALSAVLIIVLPIVLQD